MARAFAKAFYHSKAWSEAREAAYRRARGLCERCLARGKVVPGEIVHHKVHLSPANISDPAVSLDLSNLELLCHECHAAEHPEIYGRDAPSDGPRVAFDDDGNLIPMPKKGEAWTTRR